MLARESTERGRGMKKIDEARAIGELLEILWHELGDAA